MKSLFCDLGLHLWGELDFMRDLIECDLCGHQVLAEDAFRRGNSLPPMRPATDSRPDWLRRPTEPHPLDTIQTRLPEPDPIGPYGSGIDWAMAWINVVAKRASAPVASELRVGPGVADCLKTVVPKAESCFGIPLAEVNIVQTEGYRPGEWRMFDQYGAEMDSGQISALAGMPTDVKIMTSPYLPPGVTAIAWSPSRLHPDDPNRPMFGINAVALRDDTAP